MSLLPSATFAGPSQAEALWAVAGSTGPGGGVTQLVAGPNITLNPPTGEGVVTISASGGSGGGVTSLVAGTGIAVSSATGAVTVSATGVPPAAFTYSEVAPPFSLTDDFPVTTNAVKITIPRNTAGATNLFSCRVVNPAWAGNSFFTVSVERGPIVAGAEVVGTASARLSIPGGTIVSVFFTMNGDSSTASFPPEVILTRLQKA